MLRRIACACLLALTSTAHADDPVLPVAGPPPEPDAIVPAGDDVTITDDVAPPPAAPHDRHPAWKLYDRAFFALGHNDVATARDALERLRNGWPEHRAARLAATRLTELDQLAVAKIRARAERPSLTARGELVFGSTIGGLMVARDICQVCSSDRATAAAYSLAVGGGLALSLLDRNVREGEAALYNSAQLWGAWNAIGINDGFAGNGDEAVVSVSLQLTGLAAGIGAWQLWHPTRGDVAVMNSALLWSSLLSFFVGSATGGDVSLSDVTVAGDLGLLAGAWIAGEVDVSRGRTLVIDVGGVLGLLGGGLFAVGIDDNQGSPAALAIGNALGLVAGIALTRDWDRHTRMPDARIVPLKPASGGFGIGIAFER